MCYFRRFITIRAIVHSIFRSATILQVMTTYICIALDTFPYPALAELLYISEQCQNEQNQLNNALPFQPAQAQAAALELV